MRNGQNKRMRGRNRKGQNPLTRIYESSGPDVKIRGTAAHVAEKYMQLARDSQSSGDPVAAENYFQHAEHYFRLIATAQEQFRQSQPYFRADSDSRDDSFDETEDDSAGPPMGAADVPYPGREPQPYVPRETQPYVPRDSQPSYPPREQPPFPGRPGGGAGRHDGDSDRLPAFITGGGPQPQPSQGYGQNGFDGQADRFPLHRRRRRRHGPRGDMPGAQAASEGGEEAAPPPASPAQD
jgi:hypothetical protein